MASALMRLLMLATMFCLAGCLSIPQTRIAETEARIVADTCQRAWRPITYSSRDTRETVLEIRAGNAARAAYCGDDQ